MCVGGGGGEMCGFGDEREGVCVCVGRCLRHRHLHKLCNGYKLHPQTTPTISPQAPPINHTYLDGLNDLPEWQLSGQCIAVVDDGLTTPCHIESWGEGKRRDG